MAASNFGGVVPDSNPRWAASWFTQAIRQRIAERHAQFQHIHARLIKRERQLARGCQSRIARTDVNDETFFSGAFQCGKFFNDAIHAGGSFPFEVPTFKRIWVLVLNRRKQSQRRISAISVSSC